MTGRRAPAALAALVAAVAAAGCGSGGAPPPDPVVTLRTKLSRGYDERGRPLPAGTESTPVRKTVADRPVRGQVLSSVTAFRVPRGARLASIRMTSIVRLWPFRARWKLRP